MELFKVDIPIGALETSEVKVAFQSIVRQGISPVIKIKVPNFTEAITVTVNIYDEEADLVYAKASVAENAVTMDDTKKIPIVRGGKVGILPSGAPGGTGGTVRITLYPLG